MSSVLNPTPLRAVLCGALVLLAGGCATGHGHTPEELSEMIADTVRTTSGAPGLGVPDTAFDPARFLCEPAVDSPGSGSWRTEAPREPSAPDEAVELGLLPADGAGTDHGTAAVAATVVGPDGGAATAEADLTAEEWTRLVYPDDFGTDPAPGVHTVVWTDADTGTPLACDGFALE
ncbi:hypothetical protein [Nocardiopsis aegyptia]|uniref:Secreted protein n=1 Tax=Nocardiopsis aegyptia TaxID=220378 RepID=A0A7Z0JBP6_9ACTN|nr:hypothetical protein [Nocardiopsis aegyptia]NYJ36436.1 hypothetical protein [Nocardiopsis aegyptia]